MSVLNRKVLVLNRVWQAIGQKTVQQALIDLSGGKYTCLDIDGDKMIPVRWDEWIKLPPLNDDEVVRTRTERVRMPTVIIACGYSKVPKRRPKFSIQTIARRDGYRCQYTGEVLQRGDWSLDHVLPRSRGGMDCPENVVLASKSVNNRKGSKTPQEAGLPVPTIRRMPDFEQIEATHPHHELFLKV